MIVFWYFAFLISGMFYSVKKSEFIKYVVKLMEISEQDMKDQTEEVCDAFRILNYSSKYNVLYSVLIWFLEYSSIILSYGICFINFILYLHYNFLSKLVKITTKFDTRLSVKENKAYFCDLNNYKSCVRNVDTCGMRHVIR